ncbi:MAG: coproporphyrinogen III oxidase [Alphaproteobacteria bacterium]|nr:coproporphyrinogen III oxidase [Alphaproteobacteria bacterium]
MNSLAFYFHWPFCRTKCPYCDFNVHVRPDIDHAAWKNAYIKALRHYAPLLPGRQAVSVFFGGGTPSLMEPETVAAVLNEIKAHWPEAKDMEVTLEANPTSVEAGKFRAFRDAGVNRVSLGIQSLKDEALKFLGRSHDRAQALAALETAKTIFGRVNFDLIYARPGQTLKEWEGELQEAVGLAKGHMSLYQLTIERSTPFYFAQEQGKFVMPEEGLAADFYSLTQGIMEKAGLPAYEVSNHAAPGQESRHNLVYWNYGDYVGIGPGAHGRLTMEGKKFAARDHSAPDVWLEKIAEDGHGAHPLQEVPPRERFLEALMMGLRLREGVSMERLEAEGGAAIENFIDFSKLEKLKEENFLLYNAQEIQLTREGMLRLNAVVPFILRA